MDFGAKLRYLPYIAAITQLDAEWSRRHHFMVDGRNYPDTVEHAFDSVLTHCRERKEAIEGHLKAGYGIEEELAPYLFKPLRYLPTGHADALSITLFDDFDPAHSLTASCATTVEEITLGFCPDIEEFASGIDFSNIFEGNEKLEATIFPEGVPEGGIGSLFKNPAELLPFSSEDEADSDTDILIISRFKYSAFAKLGMSLAFENALWEVLLLDAAKALLLPARYPESFSKLEVRPEMVGQTSVGLIDLQAQEEIALIIKSPNATLGMTIVSKLQSLVNEPVFEKLGLEGRRLYAGHSSSDHWFCRALSYFEKIDRSDGNSEAPQEKESSETFGPEDLDKISQNHLFRWVRSTIAFPLKSFLSHYGAEEKSGVAPEDSKEERKVFPGFFSVVSQLQVSPGHQSETEDAISDLKTDVPVNADTNGCEIGNDCPEFRLHLIGKNDLVIHQEDLTYNDARLLLSADRFVRQGLKILGKVNHYDASPDEGLRNAVGFESLISIPVPILLDENNMDILCPRLSENGSPGESSIRVKDKHTPLFETILPVMKRRLCHNAESEKSKIKIPEGHIYCAKEEDVHCIDLEGLVKLCRLCGVPISLQRSLQYVFQDFTTILSNPYAFDNVLDLFDAFASLVKLLKKLADRGKYLGSEQINQVAMLVDSLHSSLDHHLYRAFPDDTNRDMNVDFRGGLNQILQSSDAVLKCANGLLRAVVLDENSDRSQVGIVSRITHVPGITITPMHPAGRHSRPRMGIVEMDVPHGYHLSSFVDLLHESFHLMYNQLRFPDESDDNQPLLPSVVPNSTLDLQLAELFVHFFCTVVLCRDKPVLLTHHTLTQYASSRRIEGRTDEQKNKIYSDLLLQLFIVKDFIEELRRTAAREAQGEGERDKTAEKFFWFLDGWVGEDEEFQLERFDEIYSDWSVQCGERFKNFFEEVKQLIPDGIIDDHDEFLSDTQINLEKVVEFLSPFVPSIFHSALRNYSKFFRSCVDSSVGRPRECGVAVAVEFGEWEKLLEIEETICTAVLNTEFGEDSSERGRPLLWSNYDQDVESGHLDCGFMTFACLRGILETRVKMLDLPDEVSEREQCQLFVERCNESGKIDFENAVSSAKLPRHWNDENRRPRFLIDKLSSSLFCCLPEERGARVQMQVAALKTFWDISSRLQAKRLVEMLNRTDTKPEQSAYENPSAE